MTTPRESADARSLALAVLLECRRKDAFVQDLLDRHLTSAELSAADRRLATQLVYGVLRRRGTLDAILRPFIHREPHQVEPWLWEALRLGAYQLLLLTHIPPHAALYETVELAARLGNARAKGFLNGVLRKVAALPTAEAAPGPAADALPMQDGACRRLSRAALPDPASDPVEYLSVGFAWPRWLAGRWHERFGWDECVRLGFWFAGPAPTWLRSNPLRTGRPSLLAKLHEAGIRAEPGEHPQAVRLLDWVPVREVPGYAEGLFVVQDQSAMAPASALAPEPGMRVLDLCAAPGGKTTHLAELMRNEGRVIGCDTDARRLQQVVDTSHRLGLSMIEPRSLDAKQHEEPPPGPFDAVLVDVPCSNTGVLGRRPEVRWRLKPGDGPHLMRLQTKLLLQACERVRPGGAVVYSTCSIEPEENRQVVRNILTAMREFALEDEADSVPGRPADGGYWARMRFSGGS
jgi:16S rRNA (cytosine967-C5)-methyltransferase